MKGDGASASNFNKVPQDLPLSSFFFSCSTDKIPDFMVLDLEVNFFWLADVKQSFPLTFIFVCNK